MNLTKENLIEKQKELVAQDPSFSPEAISFNKDDIAPRSVIYLESDNSVLIVEDVSKDKVRCIDFSDEGFRVVKLSEDIAVLGIYII